MENLSDIALDQIITLEECRRVLCTEGKVMSDEELAKIRQFLVFFAQIDIRTFKNSNEQMHQQDQRAA